MPSRRISADPRLAPFQEIAVNPYSGFNSDNVNMLTRIVTGKKDQDFVVNGLDVYGTNQVNRESSILQNPIINNKETYTDADFKDMWNGVGHVARNMGLTEDSKITTVPVPNASAVRAWIIYKEAPSIDWLGKIAKIKVKISGHRPKALHIGIGSETKTFDNPELGEITTYIELVNHNTVYKPLTITIDVDQLTEYYVGVTQIESIYYDVLQNRGLPIEPLRDPTIPDDNIPEQYLHPHKSLTVTPGVCIKDETMINITGSKLSQSEDPVITLDYSKDASWIKGEAFTDADFQGSSYFSNNSGGYEQVNFVNGCLERESLDDGQDTSIGPRKILGNTKYSNANRPIVHWAYICVYYSYFKHVNPNKAYIGLAREEEVDDPRYGEDYLILGKLRFIDKNTVDAIIYYPRRKDWGFIDASRVTYQYLAHLNHWSYHPINVSRALDLLADEIYNMKGCLYFQTHKLFEEWKNRDTPCGAGHGPREYLRRINGQDPENSYDLLAYVCETNTFWKSRLEKTNQIDDIKVIKGGTGYRAGDNVIISTDRTSIPYDHWEYTAAAATVKTVGDDVTDVEIINGGSDYHQYDILNTNSNEHGLVTIYVKEVDSNGVIQDADILNGGFGYAINDTITISQNGHDDIILTVSAISNSVKTISFTKHGRYRCDIDTRVSISSETGSGFEGIAVMNPVKDLYDNIIVWEELHLKTFEVDWSNEKDGKWPVSYNSYLVPLCYKDLPTSGEWNATNSDRMIPGIFSDINEITCILTEISANPIVKPNNWEWHSDDEQLSKQLDCTPEYTTLTKVNWDQSNSYPINSLVFLDVDDHKELYYATQDVPANTEITNSDYWFHLSAAAGSSYSEETTQYCLVKLTFNVNSKTAKEINIVCDAHELYGYPSPYNQCYAKEATLTIYKLKLVKQNLTLQDTPITIYGFYNNITSESQACPRNFRIYATNEPSTYEEVQEIWPHGYYIVRSKDGKGYRKVNPFNMHGTGDVPAPVTKEIVTHKFLRSDGTWQKPHGNILVLEDYNEFKLWFNNEASFYQWRQFSDPNKHGIQKPGRVKEDDYGVIIFVVSDNQWYRCPQDPAELSLPENYDVWGTWSGSSDRDNVPPSIIKINDVFELNWENEFKLTETSWQNPPIAWIPTSNVDVGEDYEIIESGTGYTNGDSITIKDRVGHTETLVIQDVDVYGHITDYWIEHPENLITGLSVDINNSNTKIIIKNSIGSTLEDAKNSWPTKFYYVTDPSGNNPLVINPFNPLGKNEVPGPVVSEVKTNKFLRADATWQKPQGICVTLENYKEFYQWFNNESYRWREGRVLKQGCLKSEDYGIIIHITSDNQWYRGPQNPEELGDGVNPETVLYFLDGHTEKINVVGEFPDTYKNNPNLTGVIIGSNVTSIGESAFSFCVRLRKAIIPDSVAEIKKSAFINCSELEYISIGNSVETIGWGAFGGCDKLANVIIPKSVTYINHYAFDGCNNLKSVVFLENLLNLTTGQFIFRYCGIQNFKYIHVLPRTSEDAKNQLKNILSLSNSQLDLDNIEYIDITDKAEDYTNVNFVNTPEFIWGTWNTETPSRDNVPNQIKPINNIFELKWNNWPNNIPNEWSWSGASNAPTTLQDAKSLWPNEYYYVTSLSNNNPVIVNPFNPLGKNEVPGPTANETQKNRFLRSDATWQKPQGNLIVLENYYEFYQWFNTTSYKWHNSEGIGITKQGCFKDEDFGVLIFIVSDNQYWRCPQNPKEYTNLQISPFTSHNPFFISISDIWGSWSLENPENEANRSNVPNQIKPVNNIFELNWEKDIAGTSKDWPVIKPNTAADPAVEGSRPEHWLWSTETQETGAIYKDFKEAKEEWPDAYYIVKDVTGNYELIVNPFNPTGKNEVPGATVDDVKKNRFLRADATWQNVRSGTIIFDNYIEFKAWYNAVNSQYEWRPGSGYYKVGRIPENDYDALIFVVEDSQWYRCPGNQLENDPESSSSSSNTTRITEQQWDKTWPPTDDTDDSTASKCYVPKCIKPINNEFEVNWQKDGGWPLTKSQVDDRNWMWASAIARVNMNPQNTLNTNDSIKVLSGGNGYIEYSEIGSSETIPGIGSDEKKKYYKYPIIISDPSAIRIPGALNNAYAIINNDSEIKSLKTLTINSLPTGHSTDAKIHIACKYLARVLCKNNVLTIMDAGNGYINIPTSISKENIDVTCSCTSVLSGSHLDSIQITGDIDLADGYYIVNSNAGDNLTDEFRNAKILVQNGAITIKDQGNGYITAPTKVSRENTSATYQCECTVNNNNQIESIKISDDITLSDGYYVVNSSDNFQPAEFKINSDKTIEIINNGFGYPSNDIRINNSIKNSNFTAQYQNNIESADIMWIDNETNTALVASDTVVGKIGTTELTCTTAQGPAKYKFNTGDDTMSCVNNNNCMIESISFTLQNSTSVAAGDDIKVFFGSDTTHPIATAKIHAITEKGITGINVSSAEYQGRHPSRTTIEIVLSSDSTGSGAAFSTIITDMYGKITGIQITNSGSNYKSGDKLKITSKSNNSAKASVDSSGNVTITDGGEYYPKTEGNETIAVTINGKNFTCKVIDGSIDPDSINPTRNTSISEGTYNVAYTVTGNETFNAIISSYISCKDFTVDPVVHGVKSNTALKTISNYTIKTVHNNVTYDNKLAIDPDDDDAITVIQTGFGPFDNDNITITGISTNSTSIIEFNPITLISTKSYYGKTYIQQIELIDSSDVENIDIGTYNYIHLKKGSSTVAYNQVGTVTANTHIISINPAVGDNQQKLQSVKYPEPLMFYKVSGSTYTKLSDVRAYILSHFDNQLTSLIYKGSNTSFKTLEVESPFGVNASLESNSSISTSIISSGHDFTKTITPSTLEVEVVPVVKQMNVKKSGNHYGNTQVQFNLRSKKSYNPSTGQWYLSSDSHRLLGYVTKFTSSGKIKQIEIPNNFGMPNLTGRSDNVLDPDVGSYTEFIYDQDIVREEGSNDKLLLLLYNNEGEEERVYFNGTNIINESGTSLGGYKVIYNNDVNTIVFDKAIGKANTYEKASTLAFIVSCKTLFHVYTDNQHAIESIAIRNQNFALSSRNSFKNDGTVKLSIHGYVEGMATSDYIDAECEPVIVTGIEENTINNNTANSISGEWEDSNENNNDKYYFTGEIFDKQIYMIHQPDIVYVRPSPYPSEDPPAVTASADIDQISSNFDIDFPNSDSPRINRRFFTKYYVDNDTTRDYLNKVCNRLYVNKKDITINYPEETSSGYVTKIDPNHIVNTDLYKTESRMIRLIRNDVPGITTAIDQITSKELFGHEFYIVKLCRETQNYEFLNFSDGYYKIINPFNPAGNGSVPGPTSTEINKEYFLSSTGRWAPVVAAGTVALWFGAFDESNISGAVELIDNPGWLIMAGQLITYKQYPRLFDQVIKIYHTMRAGGVCRLPNLLGKMVIGNATKDRNNTGSVYDIEFAKANSSLTHSHYLPKNTIKYDKTFGHEAHMHWYSTDMYVQVSRAVLDGGNRGQDWTSKEFKLGTSEWEGRGGNWWNWPSNSYTIPGHNVKFDLPLNNVPTSETKIKLEKGSFTVMRGVYIIKT